MPRFTSLLKGCLGLTISSLLIVGPASAPRVEAAAPAATDLLGVAYNFAEAGEDSIVFLTNTNSGDSIRAVITVRNAMGELVGCGARTLRASDQEVVYILTSSRAWTDSILSVKVFGLKANGPLNGKPSPQDGLFGSIAQVDQSSGATKSITNMAEVASTAEDRQTQIDECFASGPASPLSAADNIVTTERPSKWSNTSAKSKSKSKS